MCRVSVCVPTYNYAEFIGQTIESILNQSYDDFELIIIDDNSADDTRSVVEPYARRDARIRFSVNPGNLGMVENWNLCLAQARGEYIKFVFGDDLLAASNTLDLMVEALDADASVSLVCSARNIIDEHSRVLKVESHFATGIMVGTEVISSCFLNNKNLIGEPSVVMFRKDQATRGFRLNYRQVVDLEMWFHLLEQGRLHFIDQPLCSFRVHSRQQTVQNRKNAADINDIFYLIEDYLGKEYITLSYFMKKYVRYDSLYGVWKLYKMKKIDEDAAVRLIRAHRSFAGFRLLQPLYKLFKPCLKLYRMLTR